jgi:hypothetical protein
MGKLYNLARMTTATVGTGTIALGAAVSGYLTFANAGVADGDVVSYGIKDGANSEVGTGTYTATGTTLTRTVTKSTNGNAAISLSGSAEVFVTARAEDIGALVPLAAQTTAGAASIDFTSSIDGTFAEYLFVLSPVYSVTDGVTLQVQFSSDGGSTWINTNYDYALMLMNSNSATPAGSVAEATSQINLTDATISNVIQRAVCGEVRLFGPADTVRHPVNIDLTHWTNAGHTQKVSGGGIYQGVASAINAVRFKMSSGNIVGTIAMYGLRRP